MEASPFSGLPVLARVDIQPSMKCRKKGGLVAVAVAETESSVVDIAVAVTQAGAVAGAGSGAISSAIIARSGAQEQFQQLYPPMSPIDF